MYGLLLLSIAFSLIAQGLVQLNFKKYSKVLNSRGITGADAARAILDRNGLSNVRIERVAGTLTDHYDPTANVIRLSDGVYDSSTVAAVGVAAHEAGHAVQYGVGYAPIKLRSAIIPVTQIGAKLTTPLVLLGLMLSWGVLIDLGIIVFCAVVIFQAVTLPVEFNASGRALTILRDSYILDGDELNGARKVLIAAALTYVAALVSALISLLRLLALRGRRR
ncbi:MAG: zinc metallopeptidase [Oscillospiraceae bacterium]|nr:zinc metallopeptidase [Oscillospiraceae bacterium]